jgi:putative amide transporter protein
MIGLVLLYVGAVLLLNGIWLIGKIEDREISIINFFVGGITLLAAIAVGLGTAARGEFELLDVQFGALVLLFAFTYLWVGINRWLPASGAGLGWYCLFVAITAVPVAFEVLRAAEDVGDAWLGLNWVAWAVLWLLYFLLLVPARVTNVFTGWFTIAVAILTGWIPGWLVLFEHIEML